MHRTRHVVDPRNCRFTAFTVRLIHDSKSLNQNETVTNRTFKCKIFFKTKTHTQLVSELKKKKKKNTSIKLTK